LLEPLVVKYQTVAGIQVRRDRASVLGVPGCRIGVNLHGKWFWLKLREAGGWLIAANIDTRVLR